MPEAVQVAFRVYATDWGLRGQGSRQIDWLVDGVKLHRDNVLFVIDQPISRPYRKALEAKYRVYDATSLWRVFGEAPCRWYRFLEHYAPKHWVSYNDFHPRHKLRNRILKAAGCQTWHYSHSINLPTMPYQPWLELEYDHLVLWNDVDAAAFKGGQQHILGPLFTEEIPQCVVAVFDSTWDNYPTYTEAVFFAAMQEALERLPGVVMLYKPKLNVTQYPGPRPMHPRFYTLPEWIAPGLVIGCADVTVGIPNTSPVVDALADLRPALWFNPGDVTDDLLRELEKYIRRRPMTSAQKFRELLTT